MRITMIAGVSWLVMLSVAFWIVPRGRDYGKGQAELPSTRHDSSSAADWKPAGPRFVSAFRLESSVAPKQRIARVSKRMGSLQEQYGGRKVLRIGRNSQTQSDPIDTYTGYTWSGASERGHRRGFD